MSWCWQQFCFSDVKSHIFLSECKKLHCFRAEFRIKNPFRQSYFRRLLPQVGLQRLNIFINGSQLFDFTPHPSLPILHILFIHNFKLHHIFSHADMSTVSNLIPNFFVIHKVQVRCLLKEVHLHLHRLIHEKFKFISSLIVSQNINF